MGVAVYWIYTCVFIGLEIFFLVCGYETTSILCIGLCWIVTVLGFGINGIRLSDYLKSNYPLEYQKMLESKKLSSQLKYKPKLKDPLLTNNLYSLFTLCFVWDFCAFYCAYFVYVADIVVYHLLTIAV